ncbi:MAG TPA: Crp/Fnr family transcriptional regulator [Solimonas sp.]|nr:Crp/Fnr family transcriptional regulator [Solimonas sp.]
MSWSEERAALVASDWFRELPPEVVTGFAAMAVRRRLADGELLFARGDVPDGLWGVVSGRIRAGSISSEGKELLVMQFEPGAWFGEISMFDGLPRTHDARAVGPTEMLMLPRDRFLALLATQPELYPHFVKMLCRKLRLAFSWIEDAQFVSLPARLARRLLDLLALYGRDTPQGQLIDLHLPQDDLGRMLGASRQSISKELKAWEARGWIAVDYGKLSVRDLAALRGIADGG